ncbi:unnamed protein product [Dicrocoelium dendriticum]|nr:unnamed protein product [Dicrocoelium dendriticum]
MPDPLVTIRLPKSWKSAFWILLAGGSIFSLSYLLWSRLFSAKKKVGAHIESDGGQLKSDMSTFPNLGRKLTGNVTHSLSSHTSVFEKRSSFVPPYNSASGALLGLDSDLDDTSSSPVDFGRLGLLALAGVVEHLENLMTKIHLFEANSQLDKTSDSGQLINELRLLLEHAYQLSEQYRRKLILESQESRTGSVHNDVTSEDETCSYFSALEQIDLTELEYQISKNLHRPIYCEALRTLDESGIPYRSLRTELVGCERDMEYLAKLHCLRQAFDSIFDQPAPTQWLRIAGKLSGFRLLHCLGYPTTDFDEAYERLLAFVLSQRCQPNSTISEELAIKGVKVVNFYDVVIDLMLLDAFEILSNPPNSVLTITRHRWLSDNFKRVSLDSTIWTILLAKRKLLTYADGFYAHYYTLVGTITPALAWGFLGPDEGALRMCNRFREVVTAFLREAFTFRDDFERPSDGANSRLTFTPANEVDCVNDDTDDETLVRRDDSHGLELNDANEVDDADDSSTIVYRAAFPSGLSDHTLDVPENNLIGLRYTTLPELTHDLYSLFIRYISQLSRMFREEARLTGSPLPEEWSTNPDPPSLHVF